MPTPPGHANGPSSNPPDGELDRQQRLDALKRRYEDRIQAMLLLPWLPQRYQRLVLLRNSYGALFEQLTKDLSGADQGKRREAWETYLYVEPRLAAYLFAEVDRLAMHDSEWSDVSSAGRWRWLLDDVLDALTYLTGFIVEQGHYHHDPTYGPTPWRYVAATINHTASQRRRQRTALSRRSYTPIQQQEAEGDDEENFLDSLSDGESAEDAALRHMENQALDVAAFFPNLTKKPLLYAKLRFGEGYTRAVKDIATDLGIDANKAGRINEGLSQAETSFMLEHEACFARKLIAWSASLAPVLQPTFHRANDPRFTRSPLRIELGDHPGNPPALEKRILAATFDARKAADTDTYAMSPETGGIFLPLTSGPSNRPGRLYLFAGQRAKENMPRLVHAHLRTHNPKINPQVLSLATLRITRHDMQPQPTGLPFLDAILRRVAGVVGDSLRLGILFSTRTDEERLFPFALIDPLLWEPSPYRDMDSWRLRVHDLTPTPEPRARFIGSVGGSNGPQSDRTSH